MPIRKQYLYFLCTASLLYCTPVFAYLDPGTGSILLQGLLAGIAGVVTVGKLYWNRIKTFFYLKFLGKKTEIIKSQNEGEEKD